MTDYWDLPGFEHLYLEDSWVLSVKGTESTLTIGVDFVLRESHPRYQVPRSGEQYCYRRGYVRFEGATALSWTGQGSAPAIDANGEHDFGSFDEFEVEGNKFTVSGDLGRVELVAPLPTVELFE